MTEAGPCDGIRRCCSKGSTECGILPEFRRVRPLAYECNWHDADGNRSMGSLAAASLGQDLYQCDVREEKDGSFLKLVILLLLSLYLTG